MNKIITTHWADNLPFVRIAEVDDTDPSTPPMFKDITRTQLIALFGVLQQLPTHRAGTLTDLRNCGLLKPVPTGHELTSLGAEVLRAGLPLLSEYFAGLEVPHA